MASRELSRGGKGDNEYLLAWTTTPWTLPGNVALAVGADLDYVRVRDVSGDVLTLAADLAERVLRPGYRSAGPHEGQRPGGIHYEPLYTLLSRWSRITLRRRRRLCEHRGRHGHRPHRAGLWRRRHGGGQEAYLPVHPDRQGDRRSARGDALGRASSSRMPIRRSRMNWRAAACSTNRDSTSTPIPSAGAAIRRCSTWPRRRGTSAPAQYRDRLVATTRDQLVPGAHQGRALWQLAGEQRGLGAGSRPLLGHAAAHLAERRARQQLRRVHRQRRRTGGEGRAQAGEARTCTAPMSTN
jgi:hypothetical protein